MSITVYTQPGCVQCGPMKRTLAKAGFNFVEKDVTTDSAALREVEALGYKALPVVYVDDTLHWSGFRPERVSELL